MNLDVEQGAKQQFWLCKQKFIKGTKELHVNKIDFFCFKWGFSTITNSITDSTTLGLVAKVMESGTKTTKKCAKMLGQLHLPDRT